MPRLSLPSMILGAPAASPRFSNSYIGGDTDFLFRFHKVIASNEKVYNIFIFPVFFAFFLYWKRMPI